MAKEMTIAGFIDVFVVETKRFVGSSVNVILTRQTCGQLSRRAAESKRRALENYFYERICYMFLILKCRGDGDLGLRTFWVLAKRNPLCNTKFRGERFRLIKDGHLALVDVISTSSFFLWKPKKKNLPPDNKERKNDRAKET